MFAEPPVTTIHCDSQRNLARSLPYRAHLHHPSSFPLFKAIQHPPRHFSQTCAVQPKHARLEPCLRHSYPLNIQMQLMGVLEIIGIESFCTAASHKRVDQSMLDLYSATHGVVLGKGGIMLKKPVFNRLKLGEVVILSIGLLVVALESKSEPWKAKMIWDIRFGDTPPSRNHLCQNRRPSLSYHSVSVIICQFTHHPAPSSFSSQH